MLAPPFISLKPPQLIFDDACHDMARRRLVESNVAIVGNSVLTRSDGANAIRAVAEGKAIVDADRLILGEQNGTVVIVDQAVIYTGLENHIGAPAHRNLLDRALPCRAGSRDAGAIVVVVSARSDDVLSVNGKRREYKDQCGDDDSAHGIRCRNCSARSPSTNKTDNCSVPRDQLHNAHWTIARTGARELRKPQWRLLADDPLRVSCTTITAPILLGTVSPLRLFEAGPACKQGGYVVGNSRPKLSGYATRIGEAIARPAGCSESENVAVSRAAAACFDLWLGTR
jgi:hypothetical protein